MQTTSSPSSSLQLHEERNFSYAKNIIDDNSLTFAEKIISIKNVETYSKKSTKISRSGDIVVVDVDLAMAQDSTGPLAIRSLNEMDIDSLQDPAKALLVIDHTFPAADEKVANLHAMIREFASKQKCLLVEGSISHQYILEYLATPGMMILGADSHTCQAGCLGAFATGIGNIGEDGANYKALEWKFSDGDIRNQFSMDSRACISNASMECGAKISVFPIDVMARKYLDENPRLNDNKPR